MNYFATVLIIECNLELFGIRLHRMKLRKFRNFMPKNGLPNPLADLDTNERIYLASKVNKGKKGSFLRKKGYEPPSIDWGFSHDPKESVLFLLCFKELFPQFCSQIHDLRLENSELKYKGFLGNMEDERGVIEAHTDILKKILLNEKKKEKKENKEQEDSE